MRAEHGADGGAEDGSVAVAKTISCREVGYFEECDEVMRGESEDEVMQAAAHGRQRHGMTDEQLGDPQTQQTIRGFVRDA